MWLAVVPILVSFLLAGVAYQQIGLARDARRYPAPGRLIDIGGRSLHVDMRGEGSPAVVFEAGIAATSLSWSLVQPKIAEITKTISYDRAGLGWSDPPQGTRSLAEVVHDFELLLDRAAIKGPIILVAHSYGGLLARAYQASPAANLDRKSVV